MNFQNEIKNNEEIYQKNLYQRKMSMITILKI